MVEKSSSTPLEMQKSNILTASPQNVNLNKKKDFLDIPALVRSIQRAEGETDCFRRHKGYCDRLDCQWRRYCLKDETLSAGGKERS